MAAPAVRASATLIGYHDGEPLVVHNSSASAVAGCGALGRKLCRLRRRDQREAVAEGTSPCGSAKRRLTVSVAGRSLAYFSLVLCLRAALSSRRVNAGGSYKNIITEYLSVCGPCLSDNCHVNEIRIS